MALLQVYHTIAASAGCGPWTASQPPTLRPLAIGAKSAGKEKWNEPFQLWSPQRKPPLGWFISGFQFSFPADFAPIARSFGWNPPRCGCKAGSRKKTLEEPHGILSTPFMDSMSHGLTCVQSLAPRQGIELRFLSTYLEDQKPLLMGSLCHPLPVEPPKSGHGPVA